MVKQLKVYADGADVATIKSLAAFPHIKGFTTNPSLMRKARIDDYYAFGYDALIAAGGKPVSFEVFADDPAGMERQARTIAKWGVPTYPAVVKIPVTNTRGVSTADLVSALTGDGIRVNVTAITMLEQATDVIDAIRGPGSIVSIFAGRIADTGVDPEPIMRDAATYAHESESKPEVLWASTREVFNFVQAERSGCDIITMTPELLAKLSLFGRDLAEYSLETVKQFHNDARGFNL